MLTIGKLGIGQANYYLDKVAEGAEDYYSGDGEAEGRWMGDAAEELGLEGEVSPEQLKAMLTGLNPVDGEPLVGMRGVPTKGAVPGFDLTFSAPKSVSLLWALGGAEAGSAVSRAHDRSVEAALDYMQREACWTRRGAGGSEFVKGNGYLAAAYVHRSSRNGDPQLHTHVLVANATQADGRWTRLYHPAIYDHAKTAGYIYEAQLRHELSRNLGVRWQEVRNGIAEIDGFADEHLRAFSTRRAEILEAAGPDASARARQIANLTTRETKEKGVTRETLRQRWQAKANEIGLDCTEISRSFDPGAPAVARTVSTWQVDRAVTAGVSHFDRRDAIQAVAWLLPEGAEAVHDQVVRHEHELDREAARRIREGTGSEALDLYQSEGRITVASDPETRRLAMVADWHTAFERDLDAVMVAKRNAEVERLNAMAREVRRQAGKLGPEEIQVGEVRFAAHDQVITRVNDRQADIYNRERWHVAEVDVKRERMVLEDVDQAKRVEIDHEYLSKVNPHSEAPALEHAYAITTYSAQGTTVDQAFVMADPSMDKQELYVAASRSREETFLYATPEVQVHRAEIAPEPSSSREGIPHIAEASERDRAQRAAHDEAQLEALPTNELVARQAKLEVAADREGEFQSRRDALQPRIEQARERLGRLESERAQVDALPHPEREHVLSLVDTQEPIARRRIERLKAEMAALPGGTGARRELAAVSRVLADRRELAITAARISPPTYITKELGERPSDPAKRQAWDRGVAQIERYRQEHGVRDPNKAFGRDGKRGAERVRQEAARRRLQEVQRALGLGQHAARTRQLGRGLGIGR
jgi:conjugative relaxase-like TrwC/TraI family protein